MKINTAIFVLVLVFSCVQGDSFLKERKKAILSECQAKSKLDPKIAKTLDGDKIPETEAERCYLQCYYEKSGMVVNNAFNPSTAKAMAMIAFSGEELTKLRNMIDACAPQIKTNPNVKCDIGRAVRECFHHKGKEVGFFPKV